MGAAIQLLKKSQIIIWNKKVENFISVYVAICCVVNIYRCNNFMKKPDSKFIIFMISDTIK